MRRDGQRLDLIASTQHDLRAVEDYRLMQRFGMKTVRDGVRWHRVEVRPGVYDMSSFVPMVHAARDTGTQVLWDLMHYGWPSDLGIFEARFVDRFARFARQVAQTHFDESDDPPFYTPINEISFLGWGGGEVGYLNPFATGRGKELKRILVRAAIAAIDAILEVDKRAQFVTAEPLIHIFPKSDSLEDKQRATEHNEGQYEALDLLSGRLEPELGGRPDYLGLVGLNYYFNNQWVDRGPPIHLGHWHYRPLHEMLADAYRRYNRPVFIAETGTEGGGRAPWLHYVCDEVAEARELGVPVEGVCLYPILNHPGWDDDRHCQNGLFCGIEPNGSRTIHPPLASELLRQQRLLTFPGERHLT